METVLYISKDGKLFASSEKRDEHNKELGEDYDIKLPEETASRAKEIVLEEARRRGLLFQKLS